MPATTLTVDDRLPSRDCQTMLEVRAGVDAIDRALVVLLAERQGYMDAAARIKTDRNVVHDQARIDQVVANVLEHAEKAGLDAGMAEPLWRLLIDRSIAYELKAWDHRHRL